MSGVSKTETITIKIPTEYEADCIETLKRKY